MINFLQPESYVAIFTENTHNKAIHLKTRGLGYRVVYVSLHVSLHPYPHYTHTCFS